MYAQPVTREELLGMKAAHDEKVKQDVIKRQVTQIRNEVLSAALQGKTQFIIPDYVCGAFNHFEETVAALQHIFPDSRVQAKYEKVSEERRGSIITTKYESQLIIDWS